MPVYVVYTKRRSYRGVEWKLEVLRRLGFRPSKVDKLEEGIVAVGPGFEAFIPYKPKRWEGDIRIKTSEERCPNRRRDRRVASIYVLCEL